MRRTLAIAVAAAMLAGLAAIAPVVPVAGSCAGSGSSHAALVVQHGDGSVVTRCVAFDTASITGEQLLNASGIAWAGQTFGGYGVAVCAVDAEPASFASCPGAAHYWALFVERGAGAWQLTALGVSSLTLADGDGLGLRYVPTAGAPDAPPLAAGACVGGTEASPQATIVTGSPGPIGSGGIAPGLVVALLAVGVLGSLSIVRLWMSRRRPP
jgi:hypothetical protein